MQSFCKIWGFSGFDYKFHLQKKPCKAAKEDSKPTNLYTKWPATAAVAGSQIFQKV